MITQETDDLILVNIDNGSVSTSSSETVDLPQIPPAARDRFAQRCPPPTFRRCSLTYLQCATWLWMVQVRFPGHLL